MEKTIVRIKTPIGLEIRYNRPPARIITEHGILCYNCEYGLVKNWVGFTKICTVCRGTGETGAYTTTAILY